jgi:hypothetical protein
MNVRQSMDKARVQYNHLKPGATWDVEICWHIIRSRRSGKCDVERLQQVVSENIREITDTWPIRWIVCITDTLAEQGSPAALVTSVIWMMEKMRNVGPFRGECARASDVKAPDVHTNMFKRLRNNCTDIEWRMFCAVWRRLADPERNAGSIVEQFYHKVERPGQLPRVKDRC